MMRLRHAHPSHQDCLILTLSSMFTVPNLFGAWQRIKAELYDKLSDFSKETEEASADHTQCYVACMNYAIRDKEISLQWDKIHFGCENAKAEFRHQEGLKSWRSSSSKLRKMHTRSRLRHCNCRSGLPSCKAANSPARLQVPRCSISWTIYSSHLVVLLSHRLCCCYWSTFSVVYAMWCVVHVFFLTDVLGLYTEYNYHWPFLLMVYVIIQAC